MRLRLFISGMQDPSCVARINDSVKSVKGVSFSSVDFSGGFATVETYDSLMQIEVSNAIQSAGYDVLGYYVLP